MKTKAIITYMIKDPLPVLYFNSVKLSSPWILLIPNRKIPKVNLTSLERNKFISQGLFKKKSKWNKSV